METVIADTIPKILVAWQLVRCTNLQQVTALVLLLPLLFFLS